MPTYPVASKKSPIDRARVETLLKPITAFLHAEGWTKKDAEKIFSSLLSRQPKRGRVRRIEHIEQPSHYQDIVSHWMRDKRFVDNGGRPRLLSLHGNNSFSTLVRKVSPKISPEEVLSIFKRYKTVRIVKKNRYELAKPYFSTSTPTSTAIEPLAHFLSEASATLARMLTPARRRKVESFWRMVDNPNLSESAARKFTIFVRERSQTFLEEVDDWLEAHSLEKIRRPNSRKQRRVGLGLFSIYSDFKDWRQPHS